MRVSVFSLLASLGLRRLITIVLCATVSGVVVGYALATLSNEDEGGDATVRSIPPAIRITEAQRERKADPILIDAVLTPASTPSGTRRRRARVAVTMRLRNTRGRPTLTTAAPRLIVGRRRVRSDPAAANLAGGLLKPVPSNSTVSGVLRFETAGAVTQRLVKERRAQLRVAGLTLTLPLNLRAP